MRGLNEEEGLQLLLSVMRQQSCPSGKKLNGRTFSVNIKIEFKENSQKNRTFSDMAPTVIIVHIIF